MEDVTFVIVNYNTASLVERCIQSLYAVYPTVCSVVVDNGSDDNSVESLRKKLQEHATMRLVTVSDNLGHGPAMRMAVASITSKYFFTLDSDCEVIKGGFIEAMLEELQRKSAYAIGWLRHVNLDGVSVDETRKPSMDLSKFTPYIHPCAALYDINMYRQLPPFAHHGAPSLYNMQGAVAAGFPVVKFDIFAYVRHLVAGTRRMYRGEWNITPAKIQAKREWDPKKSYPI